MLPNTAEQLQEEILCQGLLKSADFFSMPSRDLACPVCFGEPWVLSLLLTDFLCCLANKCDTSVCLEIFMPGRLPRLSMC